MTTNVSERRVVGIRTNIDFHVLYMSQIDGSPNPIYPNSFYVT
jgi:hypothetical protein